MSSTTTFAELGVPTALTDVLEREGKFNAFPIQADTLPDTLSGRDVLGRGKTGSGKTLAFSLPLVARLGKTGNRARPGHPRALVLAPTRELATQIDAVIKPLAAAYNLTSTTVFGGVSQSRQEAAMRRGVDIVVACPGRLEDLMKQGVVSLDAVSITVLDEADHMADLGFLPAVTRILTATPRNGQRLLFSATLDNDVSKLVARFLTNAVTHEADPVDSHVDAMTHHVFHVGGADAKREVVKTLASGTGRRIMFMRTKHQAQRLAKQLTAEGIPAVDLHGNLSQGARDRNLAHFSSGRANVLVATDVAARGVHVDGIELVVHVDPPAEHKAYLHRSGRTARAGSAGDVVTVVLPEQRRSTTLLLRQANIDVQPQSVSASSPAVSSLRGEVAPYVTPKPLDPQATQRGGGGAGSRNRAGTGRPHNPKGPRRAAGSSATGGSHTAGGSHAPSSGSRSSASPQSSGSRQSAASFSSGSRPSGSGRSYSSGGSGSQGGSGGQGGSGNGNSSGRSRSNRYGSGGASSNRSR